MSLISFEGIDGSGKSTLIEKLQSFLENSIVTREPRGTRLGYEIWKILNNSIEKTDLITGKRTNLFLFLASHSEHVDSVIRPALNSEKTVIVDRYIDSMFANQCLNKNLEVKKLVKILEDVVKTPFPQVTFILDIDPVIAQERINKRREETNEYTNFDSMKTSHHEKIRNYFHQLSEIFSERIVLINANQEPDKVFEDIIKILKERKLIN